MLSNEGKTNDYENFEKGMIYMKILKKGGEVEKRGEEETKYMPHAPVNETLKTFTELFCHNYETEVNILFWMVHTMKPV